MKSTQKQAWGWLAAGVLALGLNGIYQDGGAAWVHRHLDHVVARIADRSEGVLALATGRAEWYLTKANSLAARNHTGSCRVARAMARAQAKMAWAQSESGMADFEALSASHEAAMAQLEANRARIEAQMARFSPVRFDSANVHVACPRVRVEIPQVDVSW